MFTVENTLLSSCEVCDWVQDLFWWLTWQFVRVEIVTQVGIESFVLSTDINNLEATHTVQLKLLIDPTHFESHRCDKNYL